MSTWPVAMWAAAVRRVGKPDDFRAVSKALLENPFKGISGTYRYNEDHYAPVTDELPLFSYQYQQGKRVPLAMVRSERVYLVEGNSFQVPPWVKR